MSDMDYHSIMQKRIEYFAKKYEPSDLLPEKRESTPEPIEIQPKRNLRDRIRSVAAIFF
jgi:hypothetical protein